jgi:hypothetical protein
MGVLGQPPISRGRLIHDLQQHRSVHAVMPNEDDRLVMMMFQDEADGVCRTGKQVLQRITLGKPDKLRRKMPKSEKSWRIAPDLFESVPLPRTIIEIDETLEHLARRSRRRGDRFTSCNAALQGAGIDGRGMPFAADALGKGGRLSQSFLGAGEFGLAPEPFG